ncbi:hypothetical protein MKW94_019614 [Papaver nudicaule]|uniref:Uncharacterized protein n=1 Tax=Papaver nudicaule TaxID=74823 RepID=A0AA41RYT7_PAPNU|nr:hypothetical protein [Papaver nudicaule]
MARKGVSAVICIAAVVVMVIAIAQHHVVEAEPGFGGCHAKCTDECIEEGFDKPFCLLKCDNFCSDHFKVNENAKGKKFDTDKNIVGDALLIADVGDVEENH